MENGIQKECVCFSVNLSRPSLRRKVRSSEIECDADKTAIHVSKEILESEAFDRITKLDGEIRTYLYSRCVPSLLRKGVYLLPLALVSEIESKLLQYSEERAELVKAFLANYTALQFEARARLRALYNPSDYPSGSRLGAAFGLTWRMFGIDTPEILGMVSQAAFDREREKAAAFWAETRENVASVLRAELKDLVDHLVERLQDDGGKPKIFRNSLIENFDQWVALFQSRNLAKDADLAQLVRTVQQTLSGVSADDVRDDTRTRQSVRQSFEQIKSVADKLVVDKPRRAFNLDE